MMHFDDVARNPVNVSPGERSEPGFVGAAGENFEKNRARNAILQSDLCTPPLARQPPAIFLAPQAAGASLSFLMVGFLNGAPALYALYWRCTPAGNNKKHTRDAGTVTQRDMMHYRQSGVL